MNLTLVQDRKTQKLLYQIGTRQKNLTSSSKLQYCSTAVVFWKKPQNSLLINRSAFKNVQKSIDHFKLTAIQSTIGKLLGGAGPPVPPCSAVPV